MLETNVQSGISQDYGRTDVKRDIFLKMWFCIGLLEMKAEETNWAYSTWYRINNKRAREFGVMVFLTRFGIISGILLIFHWWFFLYLWIFSPFCPRLSFMFRRENEFEKDPVLDFLSWSSLVCVWTLLFFIFFFIIQTWFPVKDIYSTF